MNKFLIKYLFAIVILCTFGSSVSGQVTQLINGREFILHTVSQGETVYGIAKKYDVPQDSIFAYNANISSGIKVDQVLKIPSKKQSNHQAVKVIYHKVTKGETLYGIAKKYGVTVESIEKANPQLKNGLKADDTIQIPIGDQKVEPEVVQNEIKSDIVTSSSGSDNNKQNKVVNCDSVQTKQKQFKVALILPFKGGSAITKRIASEFYFGFKVAVDSVASKMKVGVKLYVMNSNSTNDSDKVDDPYDYNKLKQVDIIIGPLFASNIKPIAEFALQNQIPFVSPFTKSTNILEGNPYAVKITPSDKTLAKRTLSYFNTTFPNCNFILVNTNSKGKDSVLHQAYIMALEELGLNDTLRVHKINTKTASPSSCFRGGVKNVVLYMNSKEANVKAFITGFNKAHKSTDISLVGTEKWLEFNNVEADYYMNLNLHIPIATYPDFTDSTKYDYFIRKYQGLAKTDPSEYSFKGYKIGSDLMSRFFTYGENFCNCMDKPVPVIDEKMKPAFQFYFTRNTDKDGWENNSIQILRVEEDYILDILSY